MYDSKAQLVLRRMIVSSGAHSRQIVDCSSKPTANEMRKCIRCVDDLSDELLKQKQKWNQTRFIHYCYYSNELRLRSQSLMTICREQQSTGEKKAVILGAMRKRKQMAIDFHSSTKEDAKTKRADFAIIHTGCTKWIINDAMMTLTKYFYCQCLWNAFVTPSASISCTQRTISHK